MLMLEEIGNHFGNTLLVYKQVYKKGIFEEEEVFSG